MYTIFDMGGKLKSKTVAIVSLLSLIAPAAGWAADTAPSDAATTTPAASPKPHKTHHRKLKRKSTAGKPSTPAHSSDATGSGTGKADLNSAVDGMNDSLGPNNPSTPNMGSPDHVPGTTGTSGQ